MKMGKVAGQVAGDTNEETASKAGTLYSTISKHPLITSGVILAAAGLAYAAAKVIKESDETPNIARDVYMKPL